jgi:hypothetical protein
MSVSPAVREKCVKQARKSVEFHKKWGRWLAAFYFVTGPICFALGIWVIVVIQRFIQMPGNQGAGQGLAIQMGALGLVLGAFLGLLFFKGVFYIVEGVKFFRGDPVSNLIVEYDTLLDVLRQEEAENAADFQTPDDR